MAQEKFYATSPDIRPGAVSVVEAETLTTMWSQLELEVTNIADSVGRLAEVIGVSILHQGSPTKPTEKISVRYRVRELRDISCLVASRLKEILREFEA